MMKRVMKEVAAIQRRDDISGLDIWVDFDEANIRHGRAMLIGPEGTPYAFCPLLFDITIPADYPLAPPQILFLTSDGVTRFHPNLYVQGKVCLSILGTWSGPSWVSTMSIQTALKSIYSLLNDNPIVNEPGYERYKVDTPQAINYSKWVQYRLIKLSLNELGKSNSSLAQFADVLKELTPRLFDGLEAIIQKKVSAGPDSAHGIVYGMSGGQLDWPGLLVALQNLRRAAA